MLLPMHIMGVVSGAKESGLMEFSTGAESLFRRAVHEIGHSTAGLAHAATVDWIDLQVSRTKAQTAMTWPVFGDAGQRAMIDLFVSSMGEAAEVELLGRVAGTINLADDLACGTAALQLRHATDWPGDGKTWRAMLMAIAKNWSREHEALLSYCSGQLCRDGGRWNRARAAEVLSAGMKLYGVRSLFAGAGWQKSWEREMLAIIDPQAKPAQTIDLPELRVRIARHKSELDAINRRILKGRT